MFLKIITKLIEKAELHTKNETKRKLYQELLTSIDEYNFKFNGITTLRYWRYFVIDADTFRVPTKEELEKEYDKLAKMIEEMISNELN